MERIILANLLLFFLRLNSHAELTIGAQLIEGFQVDGVTFETADRKRKIYKVYKETTDGLKLEGLMIFERNQAKSENSGLESELTLIAESKITSDGVEGYFAKFWGTNGICGNATIMVSVSKDKILISSQILDKASVRLEGCVNAEDLNGEFLRKQNPK